MSECNFYADVTFTFKKVDYKGNNFLFLQAIEAMDKASFWVTNISTTENRDTIKVIVGIEFSVPSDTDKELATCEEVAEYISDNLLELPRCFVVVDDTQCEYIEREVDNAELIAWEKGPKEDAQ